ETEHRRQRPQSQRKQARHSRGKLKPQSDKKVGGVNAKTKRVGDLRQTSAGKTPDQKRAEQEARCDPRDALLSKDMGFPGDEPLVGQSRQPTTSPATEPGPGASSGTIGNSGGSG